MSKKELKHTNIIHSTYGTLNPLPALHYLSRDRELTPDKKEGLLHAQVRTSKKLLLLLKCVYSPACVFVVFVFLGSFEHNCIPSGKKMVIGVQMVTVSHMQIIGCRWQAISSCP